MLENQNKELVLLEDLGSLRPTETSTYKKRFGLYKCYCGNEFKAVISSVKRKNTNSCGCYNKQRVLEANTTHGLVNHRLYKTWSNIKNRCTNKSTADYQYYGAIGITICDEWINDFKSFYDWAIDNGYSNELTIDRENNNKGYSPNNCRWTTRKVQSRNTRKIHSDNKSGYRGVCWHKASSKWRAKITIDGKSKWLGLFKTPLEGAIVYDKYITDNDLEHTKNF